MHCKICGLEVNKDSAFCPSCGSKLEHEDNFGNSVDQLKSNHQQNQNWQNQQNQNWQNQQNQNWQNQQNQNWQNQQNQNWQNQQNQNWGNQGGDPYYQQPTQQFQQKYNYRMGPKKMSDPAELYEPPNSKLNGVIVILWIQTVLTLLSIPLIIFLWYILSTQLPPEIGPELANYTSELQTIFLISIGVTILATAVAFWQAKMIRRYHNGAKMLAIILNIPGAFTLLGGNPIGILNLIIVYVLGFDQKTKEQFARYN